MKRLLIIVLVVALAGISIGADSCTETVEKSDKASKQVTPRKFKQIDIGMREGEVRRTLGKPESSDRQESEYGVSKCLYYGTLADDSYQFCFQDGKLESKNRY